MAVGGRGNWKRKSEPLALCVLLCGAPSDSDAVVLHAIVTSAGDAWIPQKLSVQVTDEPLHKGQMRSDCTTCTPRSSFKVPCSKKEGAAGRSIAI